MYNSCLAPYAVIMPIDAGSRGNTLFYDWLTCHYRYCIDWLHSLFSDVKN